MSRDVLLIAMSMLIAGVVEGIFFNFQPLCLQQLGADIEKRTAGRFAVGVFQAISTF
jgi:hypothetical protein